MSLATELSTAGTPPDRLRVTATTTLDEVHGRHLIVASELEVRARVPGIDEEAFRRLVEVADEGCTVAALVRASAEVSVDAKLEHT
jgi:lipoyl-dependent peroxiredoxin